MFRHESYNIKADCYAFSMIAYQMFEGRQPYEGMDPIKAAAAASNGLRVRERVEFFRYRIRR